MSPDPSGSLYLSRLTTLKFCIKSGSELYVINGPASQCSNTGGDGKEKRRVGGMVVVVIE